MFELESDIFYKSNRAAPAVAAAVRLQAAVADPGKGKEPMLIKTRNFSLAALTRFRDLQRLSFSILENTAASLTAGDTEKSVARHIVKEYRAAGADSFFHLPVVLFGERSALPGAWPVARFFPREKALQEGDSVILDAAPLFAGHLVDTSYSFCFGNNSAHREMMQHLSRYRDSVPDAVARGESFKAIAESVRATMREAGYEAVHTKHPGEVLGHRAIRTPRLPFNLRMQGFDAVSLGWFKLSEGLANRGLSRRSPLWNGRDTSDHAAHDGLWLVEPHAGGGPVGAKWEEILVIENGEPRWLDDAPPHVRQWLQIESGKDYRPVPREAA